MHAMKNHKLIFKRIHLRIGRATPNIETRLAVCPYAPVEASARISPAAEVEPT